jgi:hypothetical protein
MIKRYNEYSQSYKYDKKNIHRVTNMIKKGTKNGYSIKIGIKTETCHKSINDI